VVGEGIKLDNLKLIRSDSRERDAVAVAILVDKMRSKILHREFCSNFDGIIMDSVVRQNEAATDEGRQSNIYFEDNSNEAGAGPGDRIKPQDQLVVLIVTFYDTRTSSGTT
jgi:hypothetical protein